MRVGRKFTALKTEKKFLIVMLVCLLAVTAVAGTTILVNNRAEKQANIDLNESVKKTEKVNAVNDNVEKQSQTAGGQDDQDATKNTAENESTGSAQGGNHTAASATENTGDSAEAGLTQGMEALSFDENSRLFWPADGAVLLEFNMEHTIYFPTLDQYQCNPAVIIQNEKGNDVIAGAKGIVTEIGSNEEIGNYVVMALGDGYTITYGQLEDVTAEKGDTVNAGDVFAKTASPTKYYTVEGDNLYLEMEKDGVPVDPLDYIDYE